MEEICVICWGWGQRKEGEGRLLHVVCYKAEAKTGELALGEQKR